MTDMPTAEEIAELVEMAIEASERRNELADACSDESACLDELRCMIDRLAKANSHIASKCDAVEVAVQKIGMSLGSSDEWTDQATMIADVEGRVARLSRENAALREALGRIVNNKSADWFSAPHVSGDLGLRFAHCSEDGGPSFRANDLAVARATLAELTPEQQSTALNAGPENVGAGDGNALAEARATIAEAVDVMRAALDAAGAEDHAFLRWHAAANAFVKQHSAPANGGRE